MRPVRRQPLVFMTAIAVACVAVGLLFAAGCGKDKVTGPGPGPGPGYPALTSPQNVLIAMVQAYVAKDTIETKLVYDINYMGTWLDQTDPTPSVDTLFYSEEVQHVAALAHSGADISVQLDPTLTRYSDASDPPGWATILNPIVSFSIYDEPDGYTVDVASESMEFKFIPTTDSTSPTDTTWKIIRWTEIKH